MSGESLLWPMPSLECLRIECLVALSFCLPFSGLKVPRLVNWGLSPYVLSRSLVGLLSRLSDWEAWGAFKGWAGPEPRDWDLEWKRKRLVVAEEEGDDGWKCDEEEYEETLEQESTESRESGCRRRVWHRGLFLPDLWGQGEVSLSAIKGKDNFFPPSSCSSSTLKYYKLKGELQFPV